MAMTCSLSCASMGQDLTLDLRERLTERSSLDFSASETVYEDGSYDIHFFCNDYERDEVASVAFCVNGERLGKVSLNQESGAVKGAVVYEKAPASQPFLLRYDLVVISFIITFVTEETEEYFTDFLLCVSRTDKENADIERMIDELMEFNDSRITDWIFSGQRHKSGISLFEGKWNKRAYKSLGSYIQLVDQVITCYKSNFAYFKIHGKHALEQTETLVPYEKVKKISRESVNWILQNAEQLAEVPHGTGINYQGRNYLPYRVKTDISKKSRDVYENRIIVGFLHTALLNAEKVYAEFNKDIIDEERLLFQIQGRFPKNYAPPIITIKSMQTHFYRIHLEKLARAIDALRDIYRQYETLFDVPVKAVTYLPRKTGTFCEVKPYAQVFEIIVRWFRYGEYSLEKEQLILQVKTLDKLFEYYCLLRLLTLLADNGYEPQDVRYPSYFFAYAGAKEMGDGEKDIANTYMLSCGDVAVTLYYEPEISARKPENNLALYRTTIGKKTGLNRVVGSSDNYYTPDFVLKFTAPGKDEEYAIFDAKFSNRATILDYSFDEVIRKYAREVAVIGPVRSPRMVWILQGRAATAERPLWRYHDGPLSAAYPPLTSYGIVSVNGTGDIRTNLWNEIRKNIALLHDGAPAEKRN